MNKKVTAVLWRRCNKATFDTLTGVSHGQYDIRLTTGPEIEGFFDGLTRSAHTELGGFTVDVPLEAYDGPEPLAASAIQVRYMGERSQRADWYIRAQRPESAYELWRRGRGVEANEAEAAASYLVIVRDSDNRFHGRWIKGPDVAHLPATIREAIGRGDVGVIDL